MSAWTVVLLKKKGSCVTAPVPSGLTGLCCDSEVNVLPPFRDGSRTSSKKIQHSVGDETDVHESVALTEDGKVEAPIADSVVHQMSLQKGDYMRACTIATISVEPAMKGQSCKGRLEVRIAGESDDALTFRQMAF